MFIPSFLRRHRPATPLAAAPPRDTDRDWEEIARTEPYHGVLTSPDYLRANLTADAIEAFFASGRREIDAALAQMQARFGVFAPASALDFGCGVGRLTRALHDATGHAVGVDIAPAMLAEARREVRPGLSFVDVLPDRTFDWIVSIIVFQHIPPERGYGLMRDLCARLAPGGGVTLLVPFYRNDRHEAVPGGRLTASGETPAPAPCTLPEGAMMMYDYDLSKIVQTLFQAGVEDVHLAHTDHGGFHGALIYGRRSG